MNMHKNAKLMPLGRERMVNLPAAGRDDVGGLVSLPNHGNTPAKAAAVAGVTPCRGYVRDDPGDMTHLDIKKLGRFVRTGHRITGDRIGQSNTCGVDWEYLHVCIDSAACSRHGSITYLPVGVSLNQKVRNVINGV